VRENNVIALTFLYTSSTTLPRWVFTFTRLHHSKTHPFACSLVFSRERERERECVCDLEQETKWTRALFITNFELLQCSVDQDSFDQACPSSATWIGRSATSRGQLSHHDSHLMQVKSSQVWARPIWICCC